MSFRKPRFGGRAYMGGAPYSLAYIRDSKSLTKRLRAARRLRRRRYAYPSIKQEPKFLDMCFEPAALPSTKDFTSAECDPSNGCTQCLSCPAVGDNEQNRDGKKIIITQVEIKGVVLRAAESAQVTPDNATHGWIALVLDTQTNNTQLNSEDVFKSINNVLVGAGSDLYSARPFRNLLFGGRFRILKMKSWVFNNYSISMNTAGTGCQSGYVKNFTLFKKMRLPVNMNAGTTASVANVLDNSLHVIAWGSTATNHTLAYSARIRFIG